MATTFVDYTGDGNATKQFTFPSIQEADVKVDVDGALFENRGITGASSGTTTFTITSYTTTGGGNIVFDSAPASPASIRIFRDTNVDSAKATYTAGSSVKAADLNANHEQLLFAAQEEQNQTIVTSDLKDGAITSAKILDGTIVAGDLASNSVTETKIADNAVTMAKLGSGALPTDITVASANITDLTVASADIANGAVTTPKLGPDAVDGTKIADDAVDSEHIAADSLDTEHYAPTSIDSAALASNSVTESKITDGNVTTDKIANSNVTLAKLASDLKQTTVTDDDTKLPTSGAIVDYVAGQLSIFGGFTAIANESSFPNTQKASGAAVSISDAGGLVVNSSGTSTSATTVGGTTVTINNIPSNFHSSTIANGIRLIVTSTGSGQIYNYHKATLAEDDLVNLSGDINDFNERYRVGSSNPTSNNDAGDLFYNTGTNKLLVYNSATSAFEETQSVGQFFINTLSSSSATGGGSASFNNNAYRFTLSNAGTVAEQHIVSINGVIQKPNSGTSQPSEGFAIDGGDIIFAAPPSTGVDFFIITIGSTVNINEPSAGSVTAAKIASGAVETAKIADDAVDATKLADTTVTPGSYGTASAIPAITVDAQGRITAASTNAVSIPPAVGGANGVDFNDAIKARFGNGNDLQIFHESGVPGLNHIQSNPSASALGIAITTNDGNIILRHGSSGKDLIVCDGVTDKNVELYQNGSKKLETTSTGITVTGTVAATSYTGDGSSLTGVASTVADGCIYENSQTISNNYTITTNKNAMSAGPITIASGTTLTIPSGSTYTIV